MMKSHLTLKAGEEKALRELKKNLLDQFPVTEIILFGSKARGDDSEFSDIDVLVLLNREPTNSEEEKIFSMAYQLELRYDVVFGIVVYSEKLWNSPVGLAMPLHQNIDREGISLRDI